jgi:hypothetical protein
MPEQGLHADAEGLVAAAGRGPDRGFAAHAVAADADAGKSECGLHV